MNPTKPEAGAFASPPRGAPRALWWPRLLVVVAAGAGSAPKSPRPRGSAAPRPRESTAARRQSLGRKRPWSVPPRSYAGCGPGSSPRNRRCRRRSSVELRRAGDSSSPSCTIGQPREYNVRCDMSHLKSRFNKFVRDRSIKAHGRGHRRLSEPAAQRRQVRQGLPDLARAQRARARARAPRTTARRRRSPVGPHVLPGVRPRQEPQVHLR